MVRTALGRSRRTPGRASLRAAQRCSPFTRDPPSRRLRPARFARAPAAPMEVRLPVWMCPRSATVVYENQQRPSLASRPSRVLRARRRRILRLTVSPRPSIFAVPTSQSPPRLAPPRARAPARPPLTCRSRRPRRTRARSRPSPPLRARARSRALAAARPLPSRPPRTLPPRSPPRTPPPPGSRGKAPRSSPRSSPSRSAW